MNEWRLLEFNEDNPAMQMAIDEAILIARSKGLVPNTLRFYSFNPPGITIGMNQDIERFDISKIEESGLSYVRRISGGTAVLHKNDLIYSLVIAEDELPQKVVDAYKEISLGLVNGLRRLGLDVDYSLDESRLRKDGCYLNSNPYDIVINGKKISGNAQTRISNTVLQHGTIIIEYNVDELLYCLNDSDSEIKKMSDEAKEKITSIEKEIGRRPSLSELEGIIASGFEDAFKKIDMHLVRGSLSKYEIELAGRLYREKYSAKDWNHYGKCDNNA